MFKNIVERNSEIFHIVFLQHRVQIRALVKKNHMKPGKEVLSEHHCSYQARSQKFAMGGGCFGGLGAEPPAAGGWGFGGIAPAAGGTGVWGRSPQRSKILHFFAKINSF